MLNNFCFHVYQLLELHILNALDDSMQRVLGLGLGLVEASETRSLDEAEAMFFSSLLKSLYY